MSSPAEKAEAAAAAAAAAKARLEEFYQRVAEKGPAASVLAFNAAVAADLEATSMAEMARRCVTEATEPTGAPPGEEVPRFAITPAAKVKRRQLLSESSTITQLLVGNAIGDAFGYGIEMQDAYWIRANVSVEAEKWHVQPYRPSWWDDKLLGCYSDDCEMTVGLMKGLMRYGRSIDAEQMLAVWKEEWDMSAQRPPPANAGICTPEGTKRSGHGGIQSFWDGKESLDSLRTAASLKTDPGNAPPMRSMPLAFLPKEELERLCAVNADATHPHPKARAASFVVAAAAQWLVVRKGDQRQVLTVALEELKASGLRDSATEDYLDAVDKLPDWHEYGERLESMPVDIHNRLCGPQPMRTTPPRNGLGSDAMRTAGAVLYVLKWHRGPADALGAAVYVGGDVDSTAALVLGMVGGSVGLKFGEPGGIPWFYLEEAEGIEYLVTEAHAFEAWLAVEKLAP